MVAPLSLAVLGHESYWSGQWNLASWQNSVIGMAVTVLCLSAALWAGRTPVEVFSLKADSKVVVALRQRFGKKAPVAVPKE